jgi:hypothetical protein
MRTFPCLSPCVLFLAIASALAAGAEPVKHRAMMVEYDHGQSRLVEIDGDGKIAWEHKLPALSVMFHPLENGNVVVAHSGMPTGVREIDRKGNVVWHYPSKAAEVLGFERLPGGNVLLAEQGPCQAVQVDREGKIVSTVPLKTSEQAPHRQVRRIHRLANGHILAAHEGEAVVREYDAKGNPVWEYGGVENVFEAIRLPSGNTLIGCGTQKRIIEVTPEKKIVWEFKSDDAPELNLTWITSLQVLPSGNYVVANFLRGQEGKGAHAFEVTREKKVVWTYADHAHVKSITMLQVLAPAKQASQAGGGGERSR